MNVEEAINKINKQCCSSYMSGMDVKHIIIFDGDEPAIFDSDSEFIKYVKDLYGD